MAMSVAMSPNNQLRSIFRERERVLGLVAVNPTDPVCRSRCAVKGSLFQQVQVLSRQRSSRPGSYPSGCRGNEAVGAWETQGGSRPSASWQAVTCVNTETAPKDTMRRLTLPGLGEGCHRSNIAGRHVRTASPGWWVTACQQGATGNTG